MLIELQAKLRQLTKPGDRVYCAVSGGADSMALLWGMYLLREKLQLELHAAHFNHHLRGDESLRDAQFVREFCQRYEIPLSVGEANVRPGKKGLEAAAREARYAFLDALPGLVATAHTADDNAETVLMHMVRGTGLKGLGGIAPVSGRRIRPMLSITREQVLELLEEYHVPFVSDSSNETDDFLRNRLRHHVMPLLLAENPRFAENTSAMALRLRQDEAALQELSTFDTLPDVPALRQLSPAVRSRVLERFLKEAGVKEPEAEHIALAEELVFSFKPSASGDFPGGVTLRREYDRLTATFDAEAPLSVALPEEGTLELPGLRITVAPAREVINTQTIFTLVPRGPMILRSRRTGDELRLSGGRKSLKKLFIDRKIPANLRDRIPVLADDAGVLAVGGIGVDLSAAAKDIPAIQICLEENQKEQTGGSSTWKMIF